MPADTSSNPASQSAHSSKETNLIQSTLSSDTLTISNESVSNLTSQHAHCSKVTNPFHSAFISEAVHPNPFQHSLSPVTVTISSELASTLASQVAHHLNSLQSNEQNNLKG